MAEVIRDIARWAVASSLGVSAGCASSHPGGPLGQSVPGPVGVTGQAGASVPGGGGISLVGWSPLTTGCGQGPLSLFPRVTLTRALDHVATFRETPGNQTMVGVAFAALLDQVGQPCRTAKDTTTCTAIYTKDEQPSAACTQSNACSSFLLTTLGDEVTRSEERSALVSLLGTIDTPEKAVILAQYDGYIFACPADMLSGTATRVTVDGFELRSEYQNCGDYAHRQTLHVSLEGSVTEIADVMLKPPTCTPGRRPAGLRAASPSHAGTRLGELFADAAYLEAASVVAFDRLARELTLLRAPSVLIADAARAAFDEIRHARTIGALAVRFGALPAVPVIAAPVAERDALAIALENAVEGCVRETYSAVLAHHQARAAADPQVRAAMCEIAADETRHALLSWRVARWLEPRLSSSDRGMLTAMRAATLAQLMHELDSGLSPAEARAIGWPTPEMATQMVVRLGHELALS